MVAVITRPSAPMARCAPHAAQGSAASGMHAAGRTRLPHASSSVSEGVVPSLLGAVIVQELVGPSPGHLHSVWRSSVADTLVWGAHEVRSGQPSRFSPLGFQHSLFPRHGLARGAHAGSAQCMAMLEPWPTVSFLRGSLVLVAGAGCRTASAASALRERSVWYNCGMCRYVGGG